MDFKTSDFYFDLPQELIAQTPLEKRDFSRLLHMDKNTGSVTHLHFYDIVDLVNEGDLLVVNDSRVLPARLYGEKVGSGGKIEFLLLEQKEQNVWETMVKPGKKAKVGAQFIFGGGLLKATVLETVEGGNRIVRFECDGEFYSVLDQIGNMPLPPYITKKLEDKERYQTVYSNELGSSAAPTAGLHFTTELMDKLKQKGVNIAYVTLHVGLGTFRPVKVDNIQDHVMHSEHYHMPIETSKLIADTKKAGKRVIGVGTTSCRTIESIGSMCEIDGTKDFSGDTSIFIYPGYKFKVLDGLITNFHLPESTLIMLVSAFAGYDNTMNAYKIAVDEKYRFFSFGDAMLIL